MSSSSIGDLAQSYLIRHRNSSIKNDITRLTEELATGQTNDVRNLLVGNYAFLADVERKNVVLGGYAVATSEATQFTSAMQLNLDAFYDQTQRLTTAMIGAGTSPSGATVQDLADEAYNGLTAMFNTMNAHSAGRQLFSGNTTNQPPMTDVDTVLADLTAAISGAVTPDDMLTQATAWFNDPAGFVASAYQGSASAMTDFDVSVNESVSLDLRANDPLFFAAFRGAALSALANDPAFGLDPAQQTELFGLTARELLNGQSGVVSAQARVGFAEARLDRIATRNAAEVTSLNIAKNTLLEIDPFEAATKLEEAQFQLQSLYSVTVRMSQLSLVNYL